MRSAISMIETVFAIVVMGIAISALPLVLTQSQNNNAIALQQEAVLATRAKVSYILAHEWSPRSYDVNTSMSRVLDTTFSGAASNAFHEVDANSTRRVGHILADKRRKLRNAGDSDRNATAITNGVPSTNIDFFDENNESTTMVIEGMDDYIFNITMRPSIAYISDGGVTVDYDANVTIFDFNTSNASKNNITNIKMVEVNTRGTTSESNISITLRAFASNIGESSIARRLW